MFVIKKNFFWLAGQQRSVGVVDKQHIELWIDLPQGVMQNFFRGGGRQFFLMKF